MDVELDDEKADARRDVSIRHSPDYEPVRDRCGDCGQVTLRWVPRRVRQLVFFDRCAGCAADLWRRRQRGERRA